MVPNIPHIENNKSIYDYRTDQIWQRIDSEMQEKNCSVLRQTLYSILRTRFLKPISCIAINYEKVFKRVENEMFGKIVITDERSSVLLKDIIKEDILKRYPIEISVMYDINDELPEEILNVYHIIYLLCINELSDKQFNKIKTTISKRKNENYTVFSTYITSEGDRNRVNELRSLLPEVLQLGAFNCVDQNIVIIDNKPNMNWLTSRKSGKQAVDLNMINRIGKRLSNLFEHLNQFPAVVRYMNSFHESNKLIAETVLKEMKKIAVQRKNSKHNQNRKYETNYELLIIDRTVDLLTPIHHSFHFRPFVHNELERNYENDTDFDYNELKHIHCYDISLITKKLIKIKEKEKEGKNCDLIEKIDFNIENAILMAKKCKIRGYLNLLTIEKPLIEAMNSSSDSLTDSFRFNDKSLKQRNKYLKQFIDETDSEVTNNDITRLLIIYRLLKQDVKAEHIKEILNQKQKERRIDWTLIEDFVNLIKEVEELNSFSRNRSLKAIIKGFDSNKLSEELFPKIYGKERPKSKERKLFLFILGGLSYNDLIPISDQYQNEVLYCSDVLITPRMLLNTILFEESND
jgi:hypothetical protein